jgi:hypothetical protein
MIPKQEFTGKPSFVREILLMKRADDLIKLSSHFIQERWTLGT